MIEKTLHRRKFVRKETLALKWTVMILDLLKKKKKICASVGHSLSIPHIHLARNVPLLTSHRQTQAPPGESRPPFKAYL